MFKRSSQIDRPIWNREIDPDEIFLDSKNLPEFDRDQFEGRLEKPISAKTIIAVAVAFLLIVFGFLIQLWSLQIKNGPLYQSRSENNRLRYGLIFSERGFVYDRNDHLLIANKINADNPAFSLRQYDSTIGLAHTLGYIKYPSKDSAGFYYNVRFEGLDGVEKFYDSLLAGKNGLKIIETNAFGKIESESLLEPPINGQNITLSIDASITSQFYRSIKSLAEEIGFQGGAGVIMDISNGEILAMASFPEYDSQIISDGDDALAIKRYVEDKRKPFLNRITDGLYTPGSIVKPFLALGALKEGIIKPEKQILSTGSISIPNPFDPKKKSVFNDWKAHGLVDMRRALAISSNVYFFEVGGGFEDQRGLGIERIEKYTRMFGLGEAVLASPFADREGIIPNPLWKQNNFKGEEWRIGDTYNTAIGQYGFQITPLQAVRAIAAIANDGKLLTPTMLRLGTTTEESLGYKVIPIDPSQFKVVKEGLRLAVLEGTAHNLDIREVAMAAKTGTAEIGTIKKLVNSWVVGFFPYEKPRYAFALIMEKGPRENTIGALYVFRQLIEWMGVNALEYLR